jgi:hypothetical protein
VDDVADRDRDSSLVRHATVFQLKKYTRCLTCHISQLTFWSPLSGGMTLRLFRFFTFLDLEHGPDLEPVIGMIVF